MKKLQNTLFILAGIFTVPALYIWVNSIHRSGSVQLISRLFVLSFFFLSLAVGIKVKRSALRWHKKFLVALITPCILLAIIVQYFIVPQIMRSKNEANIRNLETQVNAARYCTVDSDCVITTAPCPYDCSNPINKKEVERIQKLPGGSSCMRSTNSPGHPSNSCRGDARGVSCINNTCTIDWPTLSPEDLII